MTTKDGDSDGVAVMYEERYLMQWCGGVVWGSAKCEDKEKKAITQVHKHKGLTLSWSDRAGRTSRCKKEAKGRQEGNWSWDGCECQCHHCQLQPPTASRQPPLVVTHGRKLYNALPALLCHRQSARGHRPVPRSCRSSNLPLFSTLSYNSTCLFLQLPVPVAANAINNQKTADDIRSSITMVRSCPEIHST